MLSSPLCEQAVRTARVSPDDAGQDEHARQYLRPLLHEAKARGVRREQRPVEADVLADEAEQLDGRIARRRGPQVDRCVIVQLEEPAEAATVIVVVVREDRRVDRADVDAQPRRVAREGVRSAQVEQQPAVA
jgi:hypothetical protein